MTPQRRILLGTLASLAFVSAACATGAEDFDLLIENGRVVDGTGSPGIYADVGITDDSIVA
ncbi:MAG TPA: hypothetical protein QGG47_05505, partial [Acidobacteriota bacterium]|nr:hypothetical protein [Acidobacteriota bacterium]